MSFFFEINYSGSIHYAYYKKNTNNRKVSYFDNALIGHDAKNSVIKVLTMTIC